MVHEYTDSYGSKLFSTDTGRNIKRVIFDRFNVSAGVREMVSIHWTECFMWADADDTGGLGLSMVEWEDGSKTFASGLYSSKGLMKVVVGCYGSPQLWRE